MTKTKKIDGNNLLSNVSSKYGAPMGRPTIADDPSARVRLFKMIFVDGDYDRGGAYWGGDSTIYVALGDGFQAFRRAETREEAKQSLLDAYPDLRFYR